MTLSEEERLSKKLSRLDKEGMVYSKTWKDTYKKWIEVKWANLSKKEKPKWFKEDLLIEDQINFVKNHRYPNLIFSSWGCHPEGTYFVEIPNFQLSKGYNTAQTRIGFILPVGYPTAGPVDFYTDPDLRLEHGGWLNNTCGGQEYLNFKWWHKVLIRPNFWSPNRDKVYNYVMLVKNRLNKVI